MTQLRRNHQTHFQVFDFGLQLTVSVLSRTAFPIIHSVPLLFTKIPNCSQKFALKANFQKTDTAFGTSEMRKAEPQCDVLPHWLLAEDQGLSAAPSRSHCVPSPSPRPATRESAGLTPRTTKNTPRCPRTCQRISLRPVPRDPGLSAPGATELRTPLGADLEQEPKRSPQPRPRLRLLQAPRHPEPTAPGRQVAAAHARFLSPDPPQG